jgi:hypothetical protein
MAETDILQQIQTMQLLKEEAMEKMMSLEKRLRDPLTKGNRKMKNPLVKLKN